MDGGRSLNGGGGGSGGDGGEGSGNGGVLAPGVALRCLYEIRKQRNETLLSFYFSPIVSSWLTCFVLAVPLIKKKKKKIKEGRGYLSGAAD